MTQNETKLDMELSQFNGNRELEEFYTNGTVDNLLEKVEENKKELVAKMVEYAEKNTVATKWDKFGNPLDYEVKVNPVVINNTFFKSIAPISSTEPMYNAEKLGMVYDYYCQLLTEVNDKIGNFPSSLTLFCRFAGITTSTLRNYKNSADYNMRVIAEKIYDQVGDDNIAMSQMGVEREKTTLFKLKSQNEMVEKVQPKLNVNANIVDIDMDKIQKRIDNYKNYATKKVDYGRNKQK